jgi:hypothetical protein
MRTPIALQFIFRPRLAAVAALALVLLGMLAEPSLAASAGATATSPSKGVFTGGTHTWSVFSPTASDVISWSAGVNYADSRKAPHTPKPFRTEQKFAFPSPGVVAPRTYTGITFHDPGPCNSMAISVGSGFGFITPSAYFGTQDVCSWNTIATGFLGSACTNPNWYANTDADDPWIMRPSDFTAGEGVVDMSIPVSINSAHFSGHGRVEVHVSIVTFSGSRPLLDGTITASGVDITLGSGADLGFFLRDSLTQAPPDPGSPSMSAAALKAAVMSDIAGDSLVHPLPLAVVIWGMTVPTTTMSDGSLIAVHVDIDVSDYNADNRFGFTSLASSVYIPPQGTSCVMVGFDGIGPAGSPQPTTAACAYSQLADGSWMLKHMWDWTAGSGYPLAPLGAGNGWVVAPCSGVYPTFGGTFYPLAAVTEISDPVPTLPSFALGFGSADGPVFNPNLGLGGGIGPTITIQPGLSMNTVPQSIGANHWQYLPLQVNVQSDPSRPWLYLGSNPSQPYQQHSYLQITSDGLFDPNGLHLPTLPLAIQFNQGPIHLNFNVQANDDGFGHVTIPQIDLGPLFAQPYSLAIGVPGIPSPASVQGAGRFAVQTLPGYMRMQSIAVTLGPAPVAGVGDPPSPGAGLTLAAPQPNPFRVRAEFVFSVPRADHVRIAIYDMQGREVRALADESISAGAHSLAWDGADANGRPAPGGIYFARIATGAVSTVRKVTLIR